MKKLYKVSFYAEMDDDDVEATKEYLADAVRKELSVDVIGIVNVTPFTESSTTMCKHRNEYRCNENCEGFDVKKDCYVPI